MPDKKLTDKEIVKALDILEKWEFFLGQRAGRELWFDKPAEIQDKDLFDFVRDIKLLKNLINRLQAENEELAYKLGGLLCHATGGKLSKHTYSLAYMETFVNDTIQEYCEEAIEETKAEAYKGFAEMVLSLFPNDKNFTTISRFTVKQKLKELVGEDNVHT